MATEPRADALSVSQLIGASTLSSWTMRTARGILHPFGREASGLLIYTRDGAMSATLSEAERREVHNDNDRARSDVGRLRSSIDATSLPGELESLRSRYASAALSYLAYAGSFEVEGSDVIHHVEHSLLPEWVGTDLRREATFDDEGALQLSLNTPGATDVLTWDRAAATTASE